MACVLAPRLLNCATANTPTAATINAMTKNVNHSFTDSRTLISQCMPASYPLASPSASAGHDALAR